MKNVVTVVAVRERERERESCNLNNIYAIINRLLIIEKSIQARLCKNGICNAVFT